MEQKLSGLEYLREEKILNKTCNFQKPFAFISYSHDDHDSQIAMNIFKKMYEKGYNLWIDVANMPADENSWKNSARKALSNPNCIYILFFRSENSMVKETILEELKTGKDWSKNLKRIISLDIWENYDNADDFKSCYVQKSEEELIMRLIEMFNLVKADNKAIRLKQDASNDIDKLAEKIIKDIGKEIFIGTKPPEPPKPPIPLQPPKPPTPPEPEDNGIYYLITKSKNQDVCAVIRKDKDNENYILLKNSKIKLGNEESISDKSKEKSIVNSRNERFITMDITEKAPSPLGGIIYSVSTNGRKMLDDAKIITKKEAEKILSENEKASNIIEPKPLPPVGKGGNSGEGGKGGKKSSTLYNYTLYGKKYENSQLNEMMITIFKEVLSHNPDKLDEVLTECKANLREGDLIGNGKVGTIINGENVSSSFRSGEVIRINEKDISIGTSAGAMTVGSKVRKLFEICGINKHDVFTHDVMASLGIK